MVVPTMRCTASRRAPDRRRVHSAGHAGLVPALEPFCGRAIERPAAAASAFSGALPSAPRRGKERPGLGIEGERSRHEVGAPVHADGGRKSSPAARLAYSGA
jgi:hypothetical protein